MLKERIQERLNEQIKHELQSAYVYFAMAGYFESINLDGFANWMIVQAQEELSHAFRIFRYINDRGGRASMQAIEAPPKDWNSPLDVAKSAYEHECMVSEMITECVALAAKDNDLMTTTFLQWFVAEQVEEEASADRLVQKLALIGDNSSGLFLLDSELSKRKLDASAAAGSATSG